MVSLIESLGVGGVIAAILVWLLVTVLTVNYVRTKLQESKRDELDQLYTLRNELYVLRRTNALSKRKRHVKTSVSVSQYLDDAALYLNAKDVLGATKALENARQILLGGSNA
ncbi:hypothetical protein VPEG_00012 [Vibrio phage SIO-2]|uniref:hypothetical protein n=1 Tax=Vibrio phage SIO-2 TaxID=700512 RepID=UPI0002357C32|nr:hypothetical protein VPEG_00012 [Vibrio phage SIO-2]AET42163.1 hypothetical protein VPEG_00012 [Vibrio phage SIO-2]